MQSVSDGQSLRKLIDGLHARRTLARAGLLPVNAKKVDRLRAEAKVVRAGGRLVWAEAEVLADGEVVGKFASTGIRVAFDRQSYISGQAASDE